MHTSFVDEEGGPERAACETQVSAFAEEELVHYQLIHLLLFVISSPTAVALNKSSLHLGRIRELNGDRGTTAEALGKDRGSGDFGGNVRHLGWELGESSLFSCASRFISGNCYGSLFLSFH